MDSDRIKRKSGRIETSLWFTETMGFFLLEKKS